VLLSERESKGDANAMINCKILFLFSLLLEKVSFHLLDLSLLISLNLSDFETEEE